MASISSSYQMVPASELASGNPDFQSFRFKGVGLDVAGYKH